MYTLLNNRLRGNPVIPKKANSYPDFYPQAADQDEDTLTAETIRTGNFQPFIVGREAESVSVHDLVIDHLSAEDEVFQDRLERLKKHIKRERLFVHPLQST